MITSLKPAGSSSDHRHPLLAEGHQITGFKHGTVKRVMDSGTYWIEYVLVGSTGQSAAGGPGGQGDEASRSFTGSSANSSANDPEQQTRRIHRIDEILKVALEILAKDQSLQGVHSMLPIAFNTVKAELINASNDGEPITFPFPGATRFQKGKVFIDIIPSEDLDMRSIFRYSLQLADSGRDYYLPFPEGIQADGIYKGFSYSLSIKVPQPAANSTLVIDGLTQQPVFVMDLSKPDLRV